MMHAFVLNGIYVNYTLKVNILCIYGSGKLGCMHEYSLVSRGYKNTSANLKKRRKEGPHISDSIVKRYPVIYYVM